MGRFLPFLLIAVWCSQCAANGNVGCLFSEELCRAEVEWCFDDGAFGRCVNVNDPREPQDLYRHSLNQEELAILEGELEKLLELGYRWSHRHTQCLLQALLYAFENGTPLDASMCHQYKGVDLPATLASSENEFEPMAYIKFTPSAGNPQSDYADEVYYPPPPDEVIEEYMPDPRAAEDEVPPYVVRRSLETHFNSPYNSPENFRSGFEVKDLLNQDEEEAYANERPYAALRSLSSWPSADELESRRKEIDDFDPEKMSMSLRNILVPSFSLFKTPTNTYGNTDKDEIEYELDNQKGRIVEFADDGRGYTEGGTVYQDEDSLPDLIDKLNGALGFKRRERLDVKKPGPPYDPAFQEQKSTGEKLVNKSQGEKEDIANQLPSKYDKNSEKPNILKKKANPIRVTTTPDYDVIDTNYAYIQFEEGIHSWSEAKQILSIAAKLLHLPNGTFSHLDLGHGDVEFKVDSQKAGMNASEVAKKLEAIKDQLSNEVHKRVTGTGIGYQTVKLPTARRMIAESDNEVYVIGVVVVGVLAALALSAAVLYLTKKHGHKLRAHVKSEGEPMSKLYQALKKTSNNVETLADLCRARMSTKTPSQQESAPAQRITSLSKESDKDSPSSRSSTSSWSEEPALTNMDVSTGQMVLSYMEEHLKNKERLDSEWAALCAYEADPSATTIAQRPENLQKNRYPHALPYDHARVVLNELSNITGSDYINASTITDHDPRNPAYIVTQGPLPHTTPDLWQMVWEQGCVAMVMLTRLGEADSPLCFHYWPEEGSEMYHVYEVHLVSEHIWCDDYLVRSFYLKNLKTGETRTVTQFHFMSWPEGGVPSSTKPLLEFRRKVNKSFRGRSCPIVVHCSDGVGRSGAYVLLDMVLNRIAKGAKEIDVGATLEHIRDQRAGAVATKQQFQFVLQAVADEVQAILKLLPQQP